MNKKTLIIKILLTFILIISATNFTEAQLLQPNIPEPTCVPVPGIPCPNETKTTQTLKKTSTPDTQSISKLFDYLSTNINQIINDLIIGVRNIFDGFRKYFEKR